MREHAPAPIAPDALYPLIALKRLTGWGDSAIRAARRGGLRLRYCHGRVFALGADVIEYVIQHGTDTAPSARQRKGTPCD